MKITISYEIDDVTNDLYLTEDFGKIGTINVVKTYPRGFPIIEFPDGKRYMINMTQVIEESVREINARMLEVRDDAAINKNS